MRGISIKQAAAIVAASCPEKATLSVNFAAL